MLPEFAWTFWLLAILGVIITGISKSGFGGGMGVITVPMLALEIGPIQAAAIVLPLLIVMDYLSVKAWWGKQLNAQLKILLPTAFLGILCGYLIFDYLNDEILKIMLGVLSILFAVWGLTNKGQSKPSSPIIGGIAGGIAGFTSFTAHAGGPPLNFYLIPLRLPREQYLATAVVFLASVNLVKLIPYAALGQLNTSNLLISALLAPFAFIGVKLGLIIQKRISDKVFYRIILSMLGIIGLKLIIDSL